MGNWTLESISWDRFDPSKVDPEILRNIKAAALVERNGGDYRIYLNRVFADDTAFIAAVDTWANEEVQHGLALGRWAQLADPKWDFEAAFARFRAGYKLPLDASASVRGSQSTRTGGFSRTTSLGRARARPHVGGPRALARLCAQRDWSRPASVGSPRRGKRSRC